MRTDCQIAADLSERHRARARSRSDKSADDRGRVALLVAGDAGGEPGGRVRRTQARGLVEARLDHEVAARSQPPRGELDHAAGDRAARPGLRRARPGARGRVPRAASSRTASEGTYGALATSTSTRPRSRAGSGSSRSPRSDQRPVPDVAPGRPHGRGAWSVTTSSTCASSCSTTAPTAAAPQHSSTTTGRPPTSSRLASPTARPRGARVRRRGTKTPGSSSTRSPRNSAQPTTCSSGRPDSRSASIASRWAASPASARRPRPPAPRTRTLPPAAAPPRGRRRGARSDGSRGPGHRACRDDRRESRRARPPGARPPGGCVGSRPCSSSTASASARSRWPATPCGASWSRRWRRWPAARLRRRHGRPQRRRPGAVAADHPVGERRQPTAARCRRTT